MVRYKGYIIEAQVVCFTIRYFVFGEGLAFNSYESFDDAKKAIDTYIAKQYINNQLDIIATQLNIDRDTVIDALSDILLRKE